MNQAERLLVCGFNPNPSAFSGKHASQYLREWPATAHPEAGGQAAALTHGRENNHALPGLGRPSPHHRHTNPQRGNCNGNPACFVHLQCCAKPGCPGRGCLLQHFLHTLGKGLSHPLLLAWRSAQMINASAGTSGAVCALSVSSSPESKTKIPRISQGRQQRTL